MNRLSNIILSALVLILFGAAPATSVAQKKKAKAPAKTSAPKANPAELTQKADEAYKAYRFDEAIELMNQKSKIAPSEGSDDDQFIRRCEIGRNMLSRVENIAIIDSITVDSADIIAITDAIRLSYPSGNIDPVSSLPHELRKLAPPVWPSAAFDGGYVPTIFITEAFDKIIWSTPVDDCGKLVTSHMLADGSWEKPVSLGESIDNMVGAVWDNIGFPFLMPDGTTLYFAADNDDSLGGWDIFVTRDNGNGFLEPQNIGMPYNSPYNDFLMAIDEVTGAGWWVTDRNQIPGKLTVYVFVPQELRINHPADTPDLIDRAKITRIAGTGATQEHNERVRNAILALGTPSERTQPVGEFELSLPGGRVFVNPVEFQSPQAAQEMEHYCAAEGKMNSDLARLAELRRSPQANTTNRAEILRLEQSIDVQRRILKEIANKVVMFETDQHQ